MQNAKYQYVLNKKEIENILHFTTVIIVKMLRSSVYIYIFICYHLDMFCVSKKYSSDS